MTFINNPILKADNEYTSWNNCTEQVILQNRCYFCHMAQEENDVGMWEAAGFRGGLAQCALTRGTTALHMQQALQAISFSAVNEILHF